MKKFRIPKKAFWQGELEKLLVRNFPAFKDGRWSVKVFTEKLDAEMVRMLAKALRNYYHNETYLPNGNALFHFSRYSCAYQPFFFHVCKCLCVFISMYGDISVDFHRPYNGSCNLLPGKVRKI